jgi:hypothetical protein
MAKVTLQIKKKNLYLIKQGIKKNDWREPSFFNKKKLLKKNDEGKFTENYDITEIEFVNGYASDAERLLIKCNGIIPVRFSRNIDDPNDNLIATEGANSIRIILGEIISL